MKSITRILLLTDFSDISENAVEYAVLMAKKTRAEIQVMHLINTPVDWVNIGVEKEKQYPETRERIADARVQLNKVVSRFRDDDIIARPVLVYNMDVENIPEYVKDEDLDLIIMGSHGARGIKEFTIGSNAQKVLRTSRKPVLIVKKKPKYDSIKEVVLLPPLIKNGTGILKVSSLLLKHLMRGYISCTSIPLTISRKPTKWTFYLIPIIPVVQREPALNISTTLPMKRQGLNIF
jgi:nucleotide-binding universal stress UspA family protein